MAPISHALLTQEGHPLAFTSEKLWDRNLGKSIYEKEMMAILHADSHLFALSSPVLEWLIQEQKEWFTNDTMSQLIKRL